MLKISVIAGNYKSREGGGGRRGGTLSIPSPPPPQKRGEKQVIKEIGKIETGYVLSKTVIDSNTSVHFPSRFVKVRGEQSSNLVRRVFHGNEVGNHPVVFQYALRNICSSSLTLIWKILRQFTLATCRLIGHQLCLFSLTKINCIF